MTKKILDRIAALFRLAENNPSEEEAARALEKARAMLQEHNMCMADLPMDDPQVESAGGSADQLIGKKNVATWKINLSCTMDLFFEVKSFTRLRWHPDYGPKTTIVFYGIDVNTRAAAAAMGSLMTQIERLAKNYEGAGKDAKASYKHGLVWGLEARLRELKRSESQQCIALAVRSAEIADRWLEDQNIKLSAGRTYGISGNEHSEAGRADSFWLQINPMLFGGAR